MIPVQQKKIKDVLCMLTSPVVTVLGPRRSQVWVSCFLSYLTQNLEARVVLVCRRRKSFRPYASVARSVRQCMLLGYL